MQEKKKLCIHRKYVSYKNVTKEVYAISIALATCILERGDGKVQLACVCVPEKINIRERNIAVAERNAK